MPKTKQKVDLVYPHNLQAHKITYPFICGALKEEYVLAIGYKSPLE